MTMKQLEVQEPVDLEEGELESDGEPDTAKENFQKSPEQKIESLVNGSTCKTRGQFFIDDRVEPWDDPHQQTPRDEKVVAKLRQKEKGIKINNVMAKINI